MVIVRTARPADAAGILAVYAPHVLHSAVTFETVVPPIAEMQSRIDKCLQRFPWAVCEIDGRIAGYVYASMHREREAYQWTCECSVYVAENAKGIGIGAALYSLLLQVLKAQGLVNVYAGITLPNEASVKLHERLGFEKFAHYNNIGYKLGAWHDVGWWRLQLNDHSLEPSAPLPFPRLAVDSFTPLFALAANTIAQKRSG